MKKLEKYIEIEKQNGYGVHIDFYAEEGPGCADFEKEIIILNSKFIWGLINGFDENNMIDVLYHEIGHLEYFRNTPICRDKFDEKYKADSEYYAFSFSLKKLLNIAENGDIEPLKASIIKLNERIEKITNNCFEDDEPSHILALDLISSSDIYKQCCDYVGHNNDLNY